MECIEARALKSSFLSQMAMKANSQVFYNDDVWCLTGINSGAAADDFPDVDELLNLDFPEKEFQEVLCFSQEDDDVTHKEGSHHSSTSTFSGADDFDSLSAGELSVPSDELENLEWLSQFVDDTTSSGLSLLCPAGSKFTERAEPNFASRVVTVNRPLRKIQAPFLLTPIPVKARSKRSRSNGRPWSLSSPPLSSGDSSSTSSSSYGSSILSPFLFTTPVREMEWFSTVEKPPAKKQKRKPAETETGSISGRRCTHCQVQKTPQWRTGPLGPKTLCNACGVRFKSGRLFPEYRPAFSPTFSHEVHSNSHRKVLEMRRKKETFEFPEPGSPMMAQSL